MKSRIAILAATSFAVLSPPAIGQDSIRYVAGNCANCHGTDGRSGGGAGMPGIAGLSRAYFIEQMRLFRTGGRTATVMHQLSKGYTDDQISRLADYFASMPK